MAEFKQGNLKLNAGQGIIFGDDQTLYDIPYTQTETDALITDAVLSGVGVENHSELNELDYASSGHTGFAAEDHEHVEADITDLDKYTQAEADATFAALSHEHGSGDIVGLDDFVRDDELTTVSGILQNQIDTLDPLPTQSGNAGKYLTTDGTDVSWATVSGLGGGGDVTQEELATVSGALQTNIDAKADTDHDHTQYIVSAENAPGGDGLVREVDNQTLTLRSIAAGTGIDIITDADYIQINTEVGGENAPGGAGIFKEVSGANLVLKSLVGEGDVVLTEDADTIAVGLSVEIPESLLDLSDTPSTYADKAYHLPMVNGDEDGIEFVQYDHNNLTALDFDSHTQYHNDARGDARYYTQDYLDSEFDGVSDALSEKEDAFSKNTAFNKNFGTEADTVCEGNDSRLSDARTPTSHTHTESDITDLGSYADETHSHSETDITDLDKYTQTEVDNLLDDKYDITGGLISGNVTITGNLTVSGTQFITDAETVEVADNMILVNAGETGAGMTTLSGGLEIDRGTESNYQFLFDEATDTFRVGEVGDTQPVATREDSPSENYLPIWDDTNKMWTTVGSLDIDNVATTSYVDGQITTLSGAIADSMYVSSSGTMTGDIDMNHYSFSFDSWTTLSGASYGNGNGYGYGDVITLENGVGYSLPNGELVYLKTDGTFADATNTLSTRVPAIGIALEYSPNGGTARILLRGIYSKPNWSLTVGKTVYLDDSSGQVTSTPTTTSNDFVQPVGFAIDDHTIYFNPTYGMVEVA